MTGFTGNDVLSSEDQQLIDANQSKLVAELETAISASSETKVWLNTAMGKAVREAIIVNKQEAMHQATTGATDEVDNARKDFEVWCGVESVFAAIITGGVEATSTLATMEAISDE